MPSNTKKSMRGRGDGAGDTWRNTSFDERAALTRS